MAKKSAVPSPASARAPITPLQFLLALDQVTRDVRGDDDAPVEVEVELDFDEDAVTQPYVQPRDLLAGGTR